MGWTPARGVRRSIGRSQVLLDVPGFRIPGATRDCRRRRCPCRTRSHRLARRAETQLTSEKIHIGQAAMRSRASFDSPERLTKMLERRWPVAAIHEYCIPERRHNDAYQNLVAYGVVWKGNLHQGLATGFDKITWYATTKNGRADEYSLGAYRGK